jgi:rod shape-determining protein MreC
MVRLMEGPPPLFRQGTPARLQLLIFSVLSILSVFVDMKFRALDDVRYVIASVIYPIQRSTGFVYNELEDAVVFVGSVSSLSERTKTLENQLDTAEQKIAQLKFLEQENQQLKSLLTLASSSSVKSWGAEVLYETRDPFTHRMLISRGKNDGVEPGYPVVDHMGVVGQVVRVFADSSEVLLLYDQLFAVPVINMRTGLRSVLYGGPGDGLLHLKYLANNSDVKEGDLLQTSGVDATYQPGLMVARVVSVVRDSDKNFAKILCVPIAGVQKMRHVLVFSPYQSIVSSSAVSSFLSGTPNENTDKNKYLRGNTSQE